MKPEMNRRDFGTLTAAAFSGLVTGTLSGRRVQGADYDITLLTKEPHVCRGLNTCKGLGKGGNNQCAGQGTGASVDRHMCNGTNDCKGEGGCGEYPGQNLCKGQGACAVPLTKKTWPKARKAFEEIMTKQGKKFGPAPAKK